VFFRIEVEVERADVGCLHCEGSESKTSYLVRGA
jgi:hypothetical protein